MRSLNIRLAFGFFCLFGLLGGISSTGQAQDTAQRTLVFNNNCNQTVRLLVYNSEAPGQWQVNGFFSVRPNGRTTFSIRGDTLTHITSNALYYYAETPSGQTFGTAERSVAHGGVNYRMSRATVTVEGPNISFGVRC